MAPRGARPKLRTLVLDIGGSHVKAAFSDSPRERKIPSGPNLGPEKMMKKLARLLRRERFDRVSIGYPGVVRRGRIEADPTNLGRGWIGFDFQRAFHRPTRVVNDAAMQALGSYRGGRMLFLGLGTGLGTAMVIDGKIAPMELAHLPYKKGHTYEDYVGEAALVRLGRKKWEKEVLAVTKLFSAALEPDYIVLGGGNVRKLKTLPPHTERGDNLNAIPGGLRLWEVEESVPLEPSRSSSTERPGFGRKTSRRRTI
jgi:glucose-6-phosphate isomerase